MSDVRDASACDRVVSACTRVHACRARPCDLQVKVVGADAYVDSRATLGSGASDAWCHASVRASVSVSVSVGVGVGG